MSDEHARQQAETEFKLLTETTLPGLAHERGYPVHLDHCFKRICMDNAVRGYWRDQIAAPFYKNATYLQLVTALGIARAIVEEKADVSVLNQRSLGWRGKLKEDAA